MSDRRVIGVLGVAALLVLSILSVPVQAQSARDLKKEMIEALKEGAVLRASDKAKALGKEGSRTAVDGLLDTAGKVANQQFYEAVRGALARVDNPEGLEYMLKRVRSGSVHDRILLAEALGMRSDEATLEGLLKGLQDKNEAVQRTALRGLKARGGKQVIEPLIELMRAEERDKGLNWFRAREALIELTGKTFQSWDAYSSWWSARRNSGSLNEIREKATADEGRSVERLPTFFGREIASKRIVFVIDVSGSMTVSDPAPPVDRQRPTTGQDRDKSRTSSRVRMDRAKAELIGVLQELVNIDGARFTIIAYSGPAEMMARPPTTPREKDQFMQVWKGKLVGASKGNVEQATQFVTALEAEGLTFTQRALEIAFQVSDADTIILLSDGQPTEPGENGVPISTDQVLATVRTLNRVKKMEVHTFGFEESGGRGMFGGMGGFTDFMKELADENGGDFSPIE